MKMESKSRSPSQNWAVIGYPTEISENFDESEFKELFIDACRLVYDARKVQALALSPLHSPDITEDEKSGQIEKLELHYAELIDKRKTEEAKQKLKSELEEKIKEVQEKELKRHFHLLFRFTKKIRKTSANSFMDWLSSAMTIERIPVLSFTEVYRISHCGAYFDYLTHDGYFDKEQFNEQAIVYPFGYNFSCKQDTIEGKDMKLSEIEELAMSGKYRSYDELFEFVYSECQKNGQLDFVITRSVMRQNRGHLHQLCAGCSLRKNGVGGVVVNQPHQHFVGRN